MVIEAVQQLMERRKAIAATRYHMSADQVSQFEARKEQVRSEITEIRRQYNEARSKVVDDLCGTERRVSDVLHEFAKLSALVEHHGIREKLLVLADQKTAEAKAHLDEARNQFKQSEKKCSKWERIVEHTKEAGQGDPSDALEDCVETGTWNQKNATNNFELNTGFGDEPSSF